MHGVNYNTMTALYIAIYAVVAFFIYIVALFAWALGIGMGYPYAKASHWSNVGCVCLTVVYPVAAVAAGIFIYSGSLYVGIYTIAALLVYVVGLFAWGCGVAGSYPCSDYIHWSSLGCIAIAVGFPIVAVAAGFIILR